jgi:hypothetical protein
MIHSLIIFKCIRQCHAFARAPVGREITAVCSAAPAKGPASAACCLLRRGLACSSMMQPGPSVVSGCCRLGSPARSRPACRRASASRSRHRAPLAWGRSCPTCCRSATGSGRTRAGRHSPPRAAPSRCGWPRGRSRGSLSQHSRGAGRGVLCQLSGASCSVS